MALSLDFATDPTHIDHKVRILGRLDCSLKVRVAGTLDVRTAGCIIHLREVQSLLLKLSVALWPNG